MSKHTLEQVLEHLINKEDDRASELLHQFFVAKGKSIYEELSQFDEEVEEDLDEGIGGAAAQDFEEEVTDQQADLEDERLFAEDEEAEEDPMAAPAMDDEPTEPEATADLAMGGEGGEEASGDDSEKVEDAMSQVEDALAELKSLFAEITGEPAGDEAGDMSGMGDEETKESYSALGENLALQSVAAPANTDAADNKKSPVSGGAKISSNGASAVKINNGSTNGGEAGTAGGQLKGNGLLSGQAQAMKTGNVGTAPGNKKAPSLQSVAAPKMNSDTASNKTSPIAKN